MSHAIAPRVGAGDPPAQAPRAPGLCAVARREWRRLRGDFWDFGMLSWIPCGVCALVWWTFAAGIPRDIPIVVMDQDRSGLSSSLVRLLDASPGVHVALQARSDAEALTWLRKRQADGVLVIPADFQRDIVAGRAVSVPWFYNGSFASHAGNLNRDVRSVVATLSAGVELTSRVKRGASPAEANEQVEPIRVALLTLFNENASNEAFLVLALIPSLLQIFVVLAAITAIGRELRAGTVPEWLEAAGGRWTVAVAGKLVIPAACFATQGALFLILFSAVRGWAIQGSGTMLSIALLLLIAAYLGVGVLLIALTLTLRNALSAAAFLTAPAFAFSGQGYPLLAMPALARAWAEALPLTHYLQLQSRHWLAGAPWTYGVGECLLLLGFAVTTGALGVVLLEARAAKPSAWGRT